MQELLARGELSPEEAEMTARLIKKSRAELHTELEKLAGVTPPGTSPPGDCQ